VGLHAATSSTSRASSPVGSDRRSTRRDISSRIRTSGRHRRRWRKSRREREGESEREREREREREGGREREGERGRERERGGRGREIEGERERSCAGLELRWRRGGAMQKLEEEESGREGKLCLLPAGLLCTTHHMRGGPRFLNKVIQI
jgi:hypothetical protein